MSDRRGDFSNLKTFQIDQRDLHIIKFGELELNKKGKDGGKGGYLVIHWIQRAL